MDHRRAAWREPALGIDLGTTNSAAAAVIEGDLQVVPRRGSGELLLPSMVGFDPGGARVVGEEARFLAETFPERVAFAVKRFMGRRWTPELTAGRRGALPFPVVGGPNEDVRVKLAGRVLPVTQVAAMILTELRLDAEAHFRRQVTKAVISVPASFDDAQRQATREAARIAGLEVLRLVNEPTAAALAYGLATRFAGHALVFDIGGGTFDVSILRVDEGRFEVVATGGDPTLGGEDFDEVIATWLLAQLEPKVHERVVHDPVSLARLRVAAEAAKRAISKEEEAVIEVELLPSLKGPGARLETLLTRHFFDHLVAVPLQRCLAVVDQALSAAHMDPRQVDQILMVGGMTRAPVIRRLVQSRFGKEPITSLDPDLAVAMGAAQHAAELAGDGAAAQLFDVNSQTLSVALAGGTVKPLVPRNVALPARATEVFHPARAGQGEVRIAVVQGEGRTASENALLGELRLAGLHGATRGDVPVEVTFALGADGILHVEAKDAASGRATAARIEARTELASAELDRLVEEEARHRAAVQGR